MDEEATFQALRQILPELQEKLRLKIEEEYQEELQKIHQYYQQVMEDALRKQEQEMKQEATRNENELRKQLSLIQRERQQWITLENNYRKVILELTEKAKQKQQTSNNISALTEIHPKNVQTEENQSKIDWKKKDEPKIYDLPIPFSKQTTNKKLNETLQRNLFGDFREDENLLEDRPLSEIDSIKVKKWKTKQSKSNSQECQQRGKRQDTMVLSPPKSEELVMMKKSVLEPPSAQPTPSMKSSIFWNQNGKKKLLSMIRNIK